ncbi:MAG: hypothetical protein J6Q73_03785 [Bacteroidaceae bacterium]|nr:hypothetical protein [Bacteroidaceae bacterium]
MRSRTIVKCRERFGYYYERVMEWLHSISYRAIPTSRARNSLIEEYNIYEEYADRLFVREFLEERTRKAIMNRYTIKIKTVHEEEPQATICGTTTIGIVRLLRKKRLIDEATLIMKSDTSNLIYWKFNN